MADAAVEQRPTRRYYCHRCSIDFEDALQDYTCPYCAGGFIEQLDNAPDRLEMAEDDYGDADMSSIGDMSNFATVAHELHDMYPLAHPMLNDLAFLMTGGRLRSFPGNFLNVGSPAGTNVNNGANTTNAGSTSDAGNTSNGANVNADANVDSGGDANTAGSGEVSDNGVNTDTGTDTDTGDNDSATNTDSGANTDSGTAESGGRANNGARGNNTSNPHRGNSGAAGGQPRRTTLMEELVWMIGGARPGTGAVTAGAPFVFVGAPGDYVFGGEGLDAVVTQLLGQLENAGPPPLPRDLLASLPDLPVSEEQAAANIACSVCWDNFVLGETVCRLECDHVFHSACIRPWLQLHATCPICRRSLMPEPPSEPPPVAPRPPHTRAPHAAPPPRPDPVAAAAAAAAAPPGTPPATTPPQQNTECRACRPPALDGARRATDRRHHVIQHRTRTRYPHHAVTALWPSLSTTIPRILLRRIIRHPSYRGAVPQPWASSPSSTTNPAPGAPPRPQSASTTTTNTTSTPSSVISDIERHYNMDLDMD